MKLTNLYQSNVNLPNLVGRQFKLFVKWLGINFTAFLNIWQWCRIKPWQFTSVCPKIVIEETPRDPRAKTHTRVPRQGNMHQF